MFIHLVGTTTKITLSSFRVQPGACYHLYNGLRESLLDDYQLPEIMRTPLEELCLQIKVKDNCCFFTINLLIFNFQQNENIIHSNLTNFLLTYSNLTLLSTPSEITHSLDNNWPSREPP